MLRPETRSRAAVVLLVAGPVAVWLPGGMFPFVLPKLSAVLAGVVLAALAGPRGRLPRGLVLTLAAGALWLVVCAVAGADPGTALVGAAGRYEGVLAVSAYAGALWSGARLLAQGPDGTVSPARPVLEATAAVVALAVVAVALLEAVGLRPVAGAPGERVGSLVGNATDMGVVGAVLALLLVRPARAVVRSPRDGRAWLGASGMVAALVLVVLSASRAALLAVVAGAVVAAAVVVLLRRRRALAVPAAERRADRGTSLVLGGAALIALAGSLALPSTAARLLGTDEAAAASASGRWLIWERALALGTEHPWFGVGPSGYARAVLASTDLRWAREVGFTHPLDSPHSWPLQLLVTGGLPLVLLALAAAALVVRAWWRVAAVSRDPWRTALTSGAVTGVVVALLTHVTTAATVCLALVLLGGLVSEPVAARTVGGARTPRSRFALPSARGVAGPRWSSIAWVVVAGGLGLVVLVGAAAEWSLRTAHDDLARGDAGGYTTACATARALRPWDRTVPAVCAQDAAAAVDAWTQDAGPQDDRLTGQVAAVVAAGADQADLALASDPRDRAALGARAVLRQAGGDLDGALDDLERVLTLTPDDPDTLLRAAVLRANLGDVDGAVAGLEHVLAVRPDDVDALTDLRIIREATG